MCESHSRIWPLPFAETGLMGAPYCWFSISTQSGHNIKCGVCTKYHRKYAASGAGAIIDSQHNGSSTLRFKRDVWYVQYANKRRTQYNTHVRILQCCPSRRVRRNRTTLTPPAPGIDNCDSIGVPMNGIFIDSLRRDLPKPPISPIWHECKRGRIRSNYTCRL